MADRTKREPKPEKRFLRRETRPSRSSSAGLRTLRKKSGRRSRSPPSKNRKCSESCCGDQCREKRVECKRWDAQEWLGLLSLRVDCDRHGGVVAVGSADTRDSYRVGAGGESIADRDSYGRALAGTYA